MHLEISREFNHQHARNQSKVYPRYGTQSRSNNFENKRRYYRNEMVIISQHRKRRALCPWCTRGARKVFKFIKIYFEEGNIHGIAYIVKAVLTIFERCFWAILLVCSIALCALVCMSSFERFYNKSTYVGLELNYQFWNTTLPSLTICPMTRLDKKLFKKYCRNNKLTEPQTVVLFNLLENLANATFTNFQNIPLDESVDAVLSHLKIEPKNYMELIYNLTYDRSYEPIETDRIRARDGDEITHSRQVLTEFGLCYMANSFISDKYSSRYLLFGKYPKYNKYEHEYTYRSLFYGSYFERDVSYTYIGFDTEYIDSYIHSPYEVMKVDNNFGVSNETVAYGPGSRETVAEVDYERDATISQRKCRFFHESNLTHFPVYTRNLCMQECRIKLAMKLCGCIPHFYPNRIPRPKPVCHYAKLRSCFPQYTKYLLKLYNENSDNKIENCFCEYSCMSAVISLRSAVRMTSSKNLLSGIGGQISMKQWPKFRFKRQVIFSLTDLLVAIGGTAGLFLGFSVLGAIEFVYFFTLRLLWYIRGYNL